MYSDKTIVCKDCGQEFTFTANEQEFSAEKGFTNDRSVANPAASLVRAHPEAVPCDGGYRDNAPRQMYDAVCADCGKSCQVPFQPRIDDPSCAAIASEATGNFKGTSLTGCAFSKHK